MCFLEFCEPLQQIIELKKGLWESLFYRQLVRSTDNNLGLVTGTCSWGKSCGAEVSTCEICAYSRQLVSQFNCGTFSLFWRVGERAVVKKSRPHYIWGQRVQECTFTSIRENYRILYVYVLPNHCSKFSFFPFYYEKL